MVPIVLGLHVAVGFLLLAASGGLAVWAFRSHRMRRAPLTRRFWQLQDAMQAGVLLQAILGIMLVTQHVHAKDPLHYLYGGVVILLAGLERGLLPGRALREVLQRDYGRFNEPLVFSATNFLVFLLLGRALTTGLWGF